MTTASLQEFIVSVPTCSEQDSLVKVWQLFQAGSEQVMVVNDRQMPLGALHLPQLTHSLTVHRATQGLPSRLAPDGNLATFGHEICDLQQYLQNHTVVDLLPQLQPVVAIPATWSVCQLHLHLPEIDQAEWVLVNSLGQYLGTFDRLRLLKFLMQASVFEEQKQSEDHKGVEEQDNTLVQGQPERVAPFTEHLSNGSALPIELTVEQSTAPSPPAVIDPLVDLLERIPVPLMLQTTSGRVVTQNLAWRQQVSELRDPGQIGREAALVLESIDWDSSASAYPDFLADIEQSEHLFPTAAHAAHFSELPQIQASGSCRLSNEPNGCVCICPMKSGQDRVWKFLKIPMGVTSLAAQPLEAPASERSSQFSSSVPFRLATLGFSPDPAWRNLAQSEFLWLVFAQDITEQHHIAKELAAKNADLVQLNRLKDEFLACISHELKTPLTAVLGLSTLLKNHSLGSLNERQSRYAQLIYQSGRHLILIVNDILDLTRIETGQLELTLEPVHIASVSESAYQHAQQSHTTDTQGNETETAQPSIQFSLEIQTSLEHVIADERRLRQMLGNLLSNALKFTEPGGSIGLRVEEWEGWIAFTVWDTGIGISADKQHLIFQKFQQLENPLTRQFEGTGLGLVLTQRLARLHGGDVTFTSVEGEGSQFTLLLPPRPPQATAELSLDDAPQQAISVTSGNRLMMLVEADPQRIEQLSQPLARLGYRVAIARSGTEALEKVRRLQPAVVFLNPILPLLSGWDVLTLLKADQETGHIPTVITATRLDREQAYQNGANAFLTLPVQPEAVRRCLERLLDSTDVRTDPGFSLTVLYLHETPPGTFDHAEAALVLGLQDLNVLLHPHHCRVLEVEDLEQADLLARVWKPNIVLLDGAFADPLMYVKQFSLYPTLASLPLVTLTAEITHAANLVPGLAVFPCLMPETLITSLDRQQTSALWQVIQMAAGISWAPHILIADVAALEANWTAAAPSDLHQRAAMVPASRSLNPLQALVHYMQIAGFRSSIEYSWQEVENQLEHHSVDLLLFCVYSSTNLHPLFLEIVHTLNQLKTKPPILVWNCQSEVTGAPAEEMQSFVARWETIATEVLPTSVSMQDLLAQINQSLGGR
ncbi:MAG: hypothetical protein Kow00121_15180 [Elainellaceae cyanobacterium]